MSLFVGRKATSYRRRSNIALQRVKKDDFEATSQHVTLTTSDQRKPTSKCIKSSVRKLLVFYYYEQATSYIDVVATLLCDVKKTTSNRLSLQHRFTTDENRHQCIKSLIKSIQSSYSIEIIIFIFNLIKFYIDTAQRRINVAATLFCHMPKRRRRSDISHYARQKAT